MANKIAIVSVKGGSGKTTTALNLAVAYAERGQRILLMDLDPQGAIGHSLAKSDTEWQGLADYMMGNATLDDAIIRTKLPTLSILPRGRLDPIDVAEYEMALNSTNAMKNINREIGHSYDCIMFDTPSGLGLATRAALTLADFVLIPLQAEPLSLRTVSQTLRVIDHVRNSENSALQLLGILATMVKLEEESSLNVMRTVWSGFATIFETFIPRADIFAAASNAGLPVAFLGGRIPTDSRRFETLVSEIEYRIAELGGVTGEPDARLQRELI